MQEGQNRGLAREWRLRSGDHAAAYRARREFAQELLGLPCQSADYASAELIFGELVHNAVRHEATEVQVALEVDEAVRLRVTDDGPGFWVSEPRPTPPNAETGRGLGIVRAVARDLNVEHFDGTCVVTAVLPLAPA